MLWVADTVSREFTWDQVHALQCLAGVLASQSGPAPGQIAPDIARMSRKVAHDLNNILAGLVSYPELMLMQLEENSPLKEPLAFIHESGLLASDIVKDFLFLVRPQCQEAPVIDPAPVVQAYFSGSAHAALQAAHPNIRFSHPTGKATLKIRISELLLTKIITVLLFHSAQNAHPDSRIDLSLSDHARGKAAGHLLIRVTDSGAPLFPDHLPGFFDPYYAKTKMGRAGSGLDLAVLKRAVLDHGGKIDAYSPGAGGNVLDVFFPGATT